MSNPIRELEEMMSEDVNIYDFVAAVKEAQDNKEHISINVVMMQEGAEFSAVLQGVNADNIKYINTTGQIRVDSLQDNYSIIVPDPDALYMMDATPGCERGHGMTIQFSFWKDDLAVAFLFDYDETVLEECV